MQHSNTAAKGSSDLQLLFLREVQGLAGPHVPCSSERCQADTAKRHAGALRALGCARNLPQRRGAPATLLVPRTAQVPGREANPLRHVPQSPRRRTDGRTDVLPHSPPAPQAQTTQPAPISAPRPLPPPRGAFTQEGRPRGRTGPFPARHSHPPAAKGTTGSENPRRAPSPTRPHEPLRRPHPLLGAD